MSEWRDYLLKAEKQFDRALRKMCKRRRKSSEDENLHWFFVDIYPCLESISNAYGIRKEFDDVNADSMNGILESVVRFVDEESDDSKMKSIVRQLLGGTDHASPDTSSCIHVVMCVNRFTVGFRRVDISEAVAISLMLTDVPKELLSGVVSPFEIFKVSIPRGVVTVNGYPLVEAMCWFDMGDRGAEDRMLLVSCDFGVVGKYTLNELGDPEYDESRTQLYPVAQLVIGLCFLIEQEPGLLTQSKRHKTKNNKKPKDPLKYADPPPSIYYANPTGIWGSEDDVEEGRRMLSAKNEGRAYNVPRWFRRGHWRRQWVGKGRVESKAVLVRPSWCSRHKVGEGLARTESGTIELEGEENDHHV